MDGGLISRGKPPTDIAMSVTTLPIRKRLSPEESREAALDAARDLLVELGPQAVTLKAVSSRIGRTHANLLHHFGSEQDPREVVELVFEAFDTGGAGALASWMILSGNEDALDPILKAIHDLVDELRENHSKADRPIEDETLQLVIMALGDALFGAPLARVLGLPRNRARQLAVEALVHGPPHDD
jgi:AcrR family transcriptional regulator